MNTLTKSAQNQVEILAVEDSPTQAEQLRHLLEQQAYKVSLAKDGKQALALLDKFEPALVISDIIMPEMDGYELCKRIKQAENKQDIPVILLTSLSNPEDVVEGLACGADSFITKPFNQTYLTRHIDQLLESKKPPPADQASKS
jgi:PleD family two-component response regulator